jgi:hypothetical protein
VLTLLHGLQKAILERRITKDSPYAKEIKLMQSQLIGLYEKMGDAAEIQIEPKNLKRYDFVFIDSVSKAGLDLSELEALREDHPRTSFIFIYHTTKAGRFRGENAHAHEVDVIVQVAEGEISANGRFVSGGKVKMG